jgi:hypothetical protein
MQSEPLYWIKLKLGNTNFFRAAFNRKVKHATVVSPGFGEKLRVELEESRLSFMVENGWNAASAAKSVCVALAGTGAHSGFDCDIRLVGHFLNLREIASLDV